MKATLHIGAPKTGTSALQSFLSRNRELLPFPYPPGRGDGGQRQGRVSTGNAVDIAHALRDGEMERATEQLIDGGVFSSELLWTAPRLKTLCSFLETFDATVIFYARPQIEQCPAGYMQRVTNNGFTGTFEEWFDKANVRLLYARRYKMLSDVSRVIVRRYDRATLVGGDIVDDFFDAIGVPVPEGAHRFPPINQTTQPFALDDGQRETITSFYYDDNRRLDARLARDGQQPVRLNESSIRETSDV